MNLNDSSAATKLRNDNFYTNYKYYFMLFILSTFQKLVYKAEEIYENYTFDEFLDVSSKA